MTRSSDYAIRVTTYGVPVAPGTCPVRVRRKADGLPELAVSFEVDAPVTD